MICYLFLVIIFNPIESNLREFGSLVTCFFFSHLIMAETANVLMCLSVSFVIIPRAPTITGWWMF